MPGFPSRGEQRKEPNSILIRGLSASPVFSLRTFSTFSTESPEAQCPWNGHFLRQLAAFPAPGSSPCFETVALLKDHYRLTRPRRRLRARISRRQPLAYPNDLQRLPFAASRSRNSARTINFAHPDLAVLSHLLELVQRAQIIWPRLVSEGLRPVGPRHVADIEVAVAVHRKPVRRQELGRAKTFVLLGEWGR